jgi:hypothetical protein
MPTSETFKKIYNALQNYGIIFLNKENGHGHNIHLPYMMVTSILNIKILVSTISSLECEFFKKASREFTKSQELLKNVDDNLKYNINSTLISELIYLNETDDFDLPYNVVIIDQFDELNSDQILILSLWVTLLNKKKSMPRLILLTSYLTEQKYPVDEHIIPNLINRKSNNNLNDAFFNRIPYIINKTTTVIQDEENSFNNKIYYTNYYNIPTINNVLPFINEIVHLKNSNNYEKGDIIVLTTNIIEAEQLKILYYKSFTKDTKDIKLIPEIYVISDENDLPRIYDNKNGRKKIIYIGTVYLGRIACYFPNIRYVIDFCKSERVVQENFVNSAEKQVYLLNQNSIEKNGNIQSKYGKSIHFRMISKNQYDNLPKLPDNEFRFGPVIKSLFISSLYVDKNIIIQNVGYNFYKNFDHWFQIILNDCFENQPNELGSILLQKFVVNFNLNSFNSIFMFYWNSFQDYYTGIVLTSLLEINLSIFDLSCQLRSDENNVLQISIDSLNDLRSNDNPFQTLLNIYMFFESEIENTDISSQLYKAIFIGGIEEFVKYDEGKEIIKTMTTQFPLSEIRFGKLLDMIRDIKIKNDYFYGNNNLEVHKFSFGIKYVIPTRETNIQTLLPLSFQNISDNVTNKFGEVISSLSKLSFVQLRRGNEEGCYNNITNQEDLQNNYWVKDLTKNLLIKNNEKDFEIIYPLASKKLKINDTTAYEVAMYIPGVE